MRLDEIQGTLYEVIRKELVANQLLPDITLFQPNMTEEFKQAKTNLMSANGIVIDLQGVGLLSSRGEKGICKIVIERTAEEAAPMATNGATFFEQYDTGSLDSGVPLDTDTLDGTETRYKEVRHPEPVTLKYRIRTICEKTSQDITLRRVVMRALPKNSHIRLYDRAGNITNEYAPIFFEGMIDFSGHPFFERTYEYRMNTVFLEEEAVLVDTHPQLVTINAPTDLELFGWLQVVSELPT